MEISIVKKSISRREKKIWKSDFAPPEKYSSCASEFFFFFFFFFCIAADTSICL